MSSSAQVPEADRWPTFSAMEGIKVLVLEAGRMVDPVRETAMFHTPNQAPLRAQATPDKQYGFYDHSVASGWEIPGEPYSNVSKEAKREFFWWRQRMMGGRTNHWGRVSLRNGPYDFETHTRQGIGLDWPISYDDLAPYYDKVEMLAGIFGANEGIENSPDSSPGVLLPPPKFRAGELLAKDRAKTLGISVVPVHRAVLTQTQNADRIPAKTASRKSDSAATSRRKHADAGKMFLRDRLPSRLLDRGRLRFDNGIPPACLEIRQSRYPAERDGSQGNDQR